MGDVTAAGRTWERFWAQVDASGVCWEWTGKPDRKGYGRFWVAVGRTISAHRWSWQQLVGPVPARLELDHLCRNRLCVNPDHLEPVTTRTNVIRGGGITAINARKTHCKLGHPFDEANTRLGRDGVGRTCRTCERAKFRRHRAQKRQLAKEES